MNPRRALERGRVAACRLRAPRHQPPGTVAPGAAAKLPGAANGAEVSTRAICERAGAQAPTLYHHFGSKQGLFDAVITHGFKQFLAERAASDQDHDRDPIPADIRQGWDLHVRYGLENPTFYACADRRGARCLDSVAASSRRSRR